MQDACNTQPKPNALTRLGAARRGCAGAKHIVMREIETFFKTGTHTLAELTGALGAPDEVGRQVNDFPLNQVRA